MLHNIFVCSRFGEEYPTLKARVLRTLCDATSPEKSLTTQYGGIVAISLFGSKAIDAFLLPVVPAYWQQWDKALATETDMERRTELLMCQQAVLVSTTVVLSFAVFWCTLLLPPSPLPQGSKTRSTVTIKIATKVSHRSRNLYSLYRWGILYVVPECTGHFSSTCQQCGANVSNFLGRVGRYFWRFIGGLCWGRN